jgi:hypothetical protein
MTIQCRHHPQPHKQCDPLPTLRHLDLGCRRWACGLGPRVARRLGSVLTCLLSHALALSLTLALRRSTTELILEVTAPSCATTTAPAAASATLALVATRASAILILWLAQRWLGARDGPRDILRSIIDVKVLLNHLGNRLNLGAQLLLDSIEVEPVFPVDQVYSQTKMSKTTRTTNTMQISLGILREVKVDDDIDSLDIYTTR